MIKREVLEGDKAEEARKKIAKTVSKALRAAATALRAAAKDSESAGQEKTPQTQD